MSSVVNTNYLSLVGLNKLRTNNLSLSGNLEKLTTGLKINKAADDASGLAIVTGMTAQIRGFDVDAQNMEDAVSLIGTADGALHESQQIAQRMRDLAVRGANGAVLTGDDQQKLYTEFITLANELNRKYQAITFNTKAIFNGELDPASTAPASTQFAMQVGPDNSTDMRIGLSIPVMNTVGFLFAGNPTAVSQFADVLGNVADPLGFGALAQSSKTSVMQDLIDYSQSIIDYTNNIRTNLGTLHNRLRHIVAENFINHANISQSRSRILDTDFAVEIADFTKNQIVAQSATAILAQANAQPQSILSLLQ